MKATAMKFSRKRLYIVIFLVVITLVCCTGCDGALSADSSLDGNMSQPTVAPHMFQSFDEIAVDKSSLIENKASADEFNLRGLDFIYIPENLPVYFEGHLESITIAGFYVAITYHKEGFTPKRNVSDAELTKELLTNRVMLEWFRSSVGDELLRNHVEQQHLKKLDESGTFYFKDITYADITTSTESKEMLCKSIYWVYDEYCFHMDIPIDLFREIVIDNNEIENLIDFTKLQKVFIDDSDDIPSEQSATSSPKPSASSPDEPIERESPEPSESSPSEPSESTLLDPSGNSLPDPNQSTLPSTSVTPIKDTSGYFSAGEAQFNGIFVNETPVDQMIELLGQPDRTEILDADTDYERTVYIYDEIQYMSFKNSNFITSIVITSYSEADSPRDIRIGDSLEHVMWKFPYEQDPEQNSDGIFFGQWNSQRGALFDESRSDRLVVKKLIVTSEFEDPFMIVIFQDDRVSEITITIRGD